MMDHTSALRAYLAKLLSWHDAHVDFDKAVSGIPPQDRGRTVNAVPYSAWQLVEHMRLTQYDILDFCRNPAYAERAWPDDYWPGDAAPPTERAWDESIAEYRADRDAFKALISEPSLDLFARIPHGSGQTYLREALLVADHTAYHLGQLVMLRRQLDVWKD